MRESQFEAQSPEAFVDRLERARDGSLGTLGDLLADFRNYLLLVANRELDDQLRAKVGPSDVVQDTLIHGQQCFADFAGGSEAEFRAWLEQILANCCRNARNTYVRTAKRCVCREVRLDGDAVAERAVTDWAGQEQTPSGLAVANEEARLVEEALRRLPPVQSQVVRWRAWECLGFEEIGQRLGRSPDAARKLWVRAVQRLEQEWGLRNGKHSADAER